MGDWGRWAAIVATIMASLSAFSVTLGSSARVLYALGRDQHFPVFFASLHPRYQTPYIALFICALMIMLVSATGVIKFVASFAGFGYLMGVGIVNCTVIALHKKMPNLRRPFKAIFFPWIPILGAITCWLFVLALEWRSFVLGGIMTLAGGGVYLLQPANRRELGSLYEHVYARIKRWAISRRRKRMRVLIVGGGKLGKSVANQLLMKDEHRSIFRSAEHQVTFVEKDERRCHELEQHYNVPIYQGDGTDKGLLEQIELKKMDVVISALNNDNQNVVASLQAKRLGAPLVISLVIDSDYVPLLEENNVVAISTPKASAIMVENYLERPGIAELFELGGGEGSLAGVFRGKKCGSDRKGSQKYSTSRRLHCRSDHSWKKIPRSPGRHCHPGKRLRAVRGLDTSDQESAGSVYGGNSSQSHSREFYFQLVERMRRRKTDELDRELRGIIKKRATAEKDPFDALVENAFVFDLHDESNFEAVLQKVSAELSKRLSIRPEDLEAGFREGSEIGMTPAADGVALPHLRFADIDHSELVLVRSVPGVYFAGEESPVSKTSDQPNHAFFFLVSPEKDPAQHLRILARIAECVNDAQFMQEWLTARNEEELKETLVHKELFFSFRLHKDSKNAQLIGRKINELQLPEEIMVALIHRNNRIVVPRSHTVLEEEDRLTIVGEVEGIKNFREQYEDKKRDRAGIS